MRISIVPADFNAEEKLVGWWSLRQIMYALPGLTLAWLCYRLPIVLEIRLFMMLIPVGVALALMYGRVEHYNLNLDKYLWYQVLWRLKPKQMPYQRRD